MRRRRLALFTEVLEFDDSYSDLLCRATDSRARELDCDLVICVGEKLESDSHRSTPSNLLYRHALEGAWDGIVLAHIFYQHSPLDLRQALAQRVQKHSCAATSVALGDCQLVSFENEQGMLALMNHLLNVHHKKRVVFVSGPLDTEDGRSRHLVWQQAMTAAGLPCGPEWVVQGDFNPMFCPNIVSDVARAAHQLNADAIVVSTDLVAEVLIRDLPAQGFRIPEDLAITGFDDIPLAAELDPGLTTVRQPVWDQFREAVDLALGVMQTAPPPAQGHLVVRESCGCPEPAPSPSHSGSWKQRTARAHERTRLLRSRVATLNVFASRIDSLTSPGDLGPLLDEWMPRLGISVFALSLTCQPDGSLFPHEVQDIFSDTVPGHLRSLACSPHTTSEQGLVFASSELAPPSWFAQLARQTLVAFPLVAGMTWFGLVLMEVGPEGNLMCRAVQELISSFLDRDNRLKAEVRRGVEARMSGQLEAEKSRTLGILVAGFAHDLATPFSVGRDSIDLLADGVKALGLTRKESTLTAQRLDDFLADASVLTGVLKSNWSRAGELVERFKRVGTEVPRDDLRSIILGPFLTDLVISLRPLWRQRRVTVVVEKATDFEVQTRVSALVDILTNLLQNAMVHAFPDDRAGTVVLKLELLGDWCRLSVEDDGVGVDAEWAAKIFDPYVTTKAGNGGTGLGLAVVRQRAQGLLGGRIRFEPVATGGARFVLDFPRVLTE